MKRVLAACAASMVAACGGGSGTNQPPPPSQCPAPVAPVDTLVGTGSLAGFTPGEIDALVASSITCTVGSFTVDVAGIFLGFPSFQGICPLVTTYGICFRKASATLVGVEIANVGVTPQSVPGPGTYTVATATLGTTTQASFTSDGPSCASPVTLAATATVSTVTIATVTSTQVTGSLNLTFADGSTLTGGFTAPIPPVSLNVCQLANQIAAGCGTSTTCVP